MRFNSAPCILSIAILGIYISCQSTKKESFDITNYYPWCIVAYDSLERTPAERIQMIQELEFNKYAYDWRDRHLDQTLEELTLATENNIEVISVWLWLNPKRDSLHLLSPSNERLFEIVKQSGLETTFWVSMSEHYFKDLEDDESLQKATEFIDAIYRRTEALNCKLALYNHKGWFGEPYNELKIIEALPMNDISMVYNFHHGHQDIDNFNEIVKLITPHLSAVNINGMEKNGSKILCIGQGSYENDMIQLLKNNGYTGPWGILGHVEGVDVKGVLKANIDGLKRLEHSLDK